MNYKVCILVAGVGNRMGDISNHVNNAILPVKFKAVISYIVEKFSADVEIVVAIGHKKDTIINYLTLAHPHRRFTYVEVDNYIGPGTGPGYSLLQCKDNLQSPFIFFAADTIVLEDIPMPDHNWFGIAPVKETEPYCTIKIKNNLIYQLDDKIKTDNKFAFIGLAGVKDYEEFFHSLEKNKEISGGEIQVSNGFRALVEKELKPIGFTWFDTGTIENYKKVNQNFSGQVEKFDFSKGDEFLYFVENRVIKFFADETITKNRYLRSKTTLKGLCPDILEPLGNFYAYEKLDGQVLYNIMNAQIVNDFLEWARINIWTKKELTVEEKLIFDEACHKFYYEKTLQRIELLHTKLGIVDGANVINGVAVPSLADLLSKIDWHEIKHGIPCNFHGDLQFDNILVTRDQISNLHKFVLLDWRQDFGGLVSAGDLYYDLAKLYGGLTMSYQLIKEGLFRFDQSGSSVYYNFYIKSDLLEAKEEYEKFIIRNNFDLNKIRIMTALIFLNMAPLHHNPFDAMLYYLGKNMLHKLLK